jgi:hypothetical protein
LKVAYPGVLEGADFPKKGYAVKDNTLDGSDQLGELIDGVTFKDGIKINKHAA